LSFELQLLMFAFVLPLAVSFLLTLLWKRISLWISPSSYLGRGLGFMMIPLTSLIVSSSRSNLWGLPSDDYHRKLPWIVLGSGLLGIFLTRQAWSRSDYLKGSLKDGSSQCEDTAFVWLLRATLLLSFAWWLIPKGKGWDDTVAYQPLWLLLAGLGGVWCWWVLQSIRASYPQCAAAADLLKEKKLSLGSAWQLWIAVGALLGMAGLAAQSFASLAEGILTLAAMGIGVALALHLHVDKREAVWMEPILGVGLSSSAALAMAYSGSAVPLWTYPAILAVPFSAGVIDRILVQYRLSLVWRVCIAATLTAILVGGILACVLTFQPEEKW